MKKYDYLIVGAGLFGAVFAHEMTKEGKKCLVIDKRNHIAGNIYCENVEGINVHKYGAHIFHTSDKVVWEYINQFAEFNNLDSVKALINEKTCAIIVEPVQGEGGIYPATKEFMEGIRKICDDNDIIMICDEIQCGMGRTGKMYAFQHYNVKPDIITTAKALGCGVPVGAFVAGEKCCDSLVPGDHGTTYGGNPLATAAVSKVFDLFEEMNILEHVNEVSNYLEEQLDKLVEQYDNVVARRGKGLMQGLVLTTPVIDTVNKAIEKGLLVISAGSDVLRMVPPLVITKENVDEMIEILSQCL